MDIFDIVGGVFLQVERIWSDIHHFSWFSIIELTHTFEKTKSPSSIWSFSSSSTDDNIVGLSLVIEAMIPVCQMKASPLNILPHKRHLYTYYFLFLDEYHLYSHSLILHLPSTYKGVSINFYEIFDLFSHKPLFISY